MEESMADPNTPTRSSNMEKAEGDRETVGNVDTPRKSEWGEGTSQGGGVSNRPIGEEAENQNQVPDRGRSNDDV
jgi:hypothetical protein